MNSTIQKSLLVIVLIRGKLSSQLGCTRHFRNSKIIHMKYSDNPIFFRLYIIIISAFGLDICGLSTVRSRARQRAGFFRVGSNRPGFPGFGPVSGLRIRKSGFRAGFRVALRVPGPGENPEINYVFLHFNLKIV